MDSILQQLFSILVAPPGNLIYHLALAFAIFASLQVALINRRMAADESPSGRALLGLNLLLIAQLALFLVSGLAWQGVVSAHAFLPIFDRAIVLISLLWISWMWAFPAPARVADVLLGLLHLAVVILLLFTYSQWRLGNSGLPFNGSWEDWAWTFSCLGVAAAAMLLMALRQPENWGLGLGMMLLIAAGLLGHLFLPSVSEDYSGPIRLALLAAFPLLPSLLMRTSPTAAPRGAQRAGPAANQQTQLQLLQDGLALGQQHQPAGVAAGVARAVAHTLDADICLVALAPTGPQAPLSLLGGYDNLVEEEIGPVEVEQAQVPSLAAALAQGRPFRILSSETQPPDLTGLGIALGLPEVGNVLLLPLHAEGAPWGGLLLLSAYSHRTWALADQNLLAGQREALVETLRTARQPAGHSAEFDQLRASLAELGLELNELRQENQALAAHQNATTPSVEAMQAENARLKDELDHAIALAQSGWVQSEATGGPTTPLENQLRDTLAEVAHLQNQLAESQMHAFELERRAESGGPLSNQDFETVVAIVQDFRQPMASVVGYTDLLLSETVGILGSLQRKFLERVRTANERMRSLLDNLIQVTALNSAALALDNQPVELNVVIDTAISEVSARLREKNIDLRIEIADDLPILQADRDGILQILSQLLQNASNVTPPNGTITLSAGLRREDESDFLIIQVTDEGGGIAAEDLPLIFNRRDRNEKVLISGVADTGVGLSIARSMVEAHRGRIWVESNDHQTSTYSVLLPIQPNLAKDRTGQ